MFLWNGLGARSKNLWQGKHQAVGMKYWQSGTNLGKVPHSHHKRQKIRWGGHTAEDSPSLDSQVVKSDRKTFEVLETGSFWEGFIPTIFEMLNLKPTWSWTNP